MLLKIGQAAPLFTLKNQDGQPISLKDFRGKNRVLLYFYPKALTPGCTTQACEIRDHRNDFKKLNTVVLGVSPDPTKALLKFREKKDLNFDLLCDEGHKIAEKYHVWGEKQFMGKKYMGVSRSSFFIDQDGKIFHIIEKVKAKSHHKDALGILKGHS